MPSTMAVRCFTWPLNPLKQALIEAHADVNARRDHSSPSQRHYVLYFALKYGSSEACELLLQAGANVWEAGSSVADLASLLLESMFPYCIAGKIKALSDVGVHLTSVRWPRSGQLVHIELAQRGNEDAVLALVADGADATAERSRSHDTALQILLQKKRGFSYP